MVYILESGCKMPPQREHGIVMMNEKRQQALLFCHEGYSSAGSSAAYCNGQHFDRELGQCRLNVGHTKSCDFETTDLCGWIQGYDNEFPWIQRNGWNSFEKVDFGPKHDHTVCH